MLHDVKNDFYLLGIAIILILVSSKFSANYEKELNDSLLATVAGGKNEKKVNKKVNYEEDIKINVKY